MVVPVKFSFWFDSQTSAELTADKMQNLLTKQEPEGASNTDLHELQKSSCAFNRQTKWKLQIFDPIARADAIPPTVVNWWAAPIKIKI